MTKQTYQAAYHVRIAYAAINESYALDDPRDCEEYLDLSLGLSEEDWHWISIIDRNHETWSGGDGHVFH
jgi:hypothetical protein